VALMISSVPTDHPQWLWECVSDVGEGSRAVLILSPFAGTLDAIGIA
jgi:hypothetical protein